MLIASGSRYSISEKQELDTIFFFSCTVNNSEREDSSVRYDGSGIFGRNQVCEGRKARPTPMDLRSIPAEVHAFESHPSHFKDAMHPCQAPAKKPE
jgi:hypothetical protein